MQEKENIFNKNNGIIYWLIVIISICAIYSIISITNSIANPIREVSIEGKAEKSISPDIATFVINLSEDGKTVSEAQEKLKSTSDKFFSSIAELKIDNKDIKVTSQSSEPKWEYPICPYYTNCPKAKIIGYNSKEAISIKIRDINNIDKLISIISKNKINSYFGPNWEIDNIENVKNDLKIEAAKNAILKADKLAKELDFKIIGISSYWENNNPVADGFYKNAEIISLSAASPQSIIQSSPHNGEQKLSISVNVSFKIK